MPKRMTIPAVLVVIAAIIGFSMYTGALDGSTSESREEILNQAIIGAHIVTEEEIDGYVVCGITTDSGEYGLAVFEPDDGGFNLQTHFLRSADRGVIGSAEIDGRSYDLFWRNRYDLERAEITYTSGGGRDVKTLDATENRILCSESPSGNYTVSVRFYDVEGNVYE